MSRNSYDKYRLGQLLLNKQQICESQLDEALSFSKQHNLLLGQALIELGYVKKSKINSSLTKQVLSRKVLAISLLLFAPLGPAFATLGTRDHSDKEVERINEIKTIDLMNEEDKNSETTRMRLDNDDYRFCVNSDQIERIEVTIEETTKIDSDRTIKIKEPTRLFNVTFAKKTRLNSETDFASNCFVADNDIRLV